MKFEDYHISQAIKKALAQLGFKRPTDIQYKAIPNILKGEDVLAIAQTGTGKTAAFAIPIINQLHTKKLSQRRVDGIKCLVLVPTHELANQVLDVFNQIAQFTKVKCLSVHGGVDQDPQIEALVEGVDVVIATPGRMFDLISQGYLKTNRIETLILDEADHMLDLGFIKDIEDLMQHLPNKRQTLFFSATINKTLKKLAYGLVHNAIRIQIAPKDPVANNIDHSVMFMEMDHKRFFLERLINEYPDSKILIFVRTKVRAERVSKAMARVEISTMTLHGDKEQSDRDAVLDAFRSGKTKLMIATDVSARGIDIPDIDFVVNYDLPDQSENYVHRVGRTGRAKKKGKAYSFCAPGEKIILTEIESFLGKPIHRILIDKDDYNETLEIKFDHDNDIDALMNQIEELESSRKKKKKKR